MPTHPSAHGTAGTRPAGRRRTLARGLAGASTAALLALSTATIAAVPALAHDQLLSTTPEAGATAQEAPDEVSLTFSGNLITGQGIQNLVTVTDEAGHQWQDGDASVTGPELSVPMCEGMPNGDYEVAYRVVYSDGHSEAKQYDFALDDPAAPQTAVPQDCGVPNPDAPVTGPAEGSTPATSGANGGAVPANPGDGSGSEGSGDAEGTTGGNAGAAPAPPTLDSPAPVATEPAADTATDTATDPVSTEAASESTQTGVPGWVWVVGILGVLIIVAAVALVSRRAKAIDGPSGSTD